MDKLISSSRLMQYEMNIINYPIFKRALKIFLTLLRGNNQHILEKNRHNLVSYFDLK